MTYQNIYQAALSDVGVFVQQLRITSLKGLEWASEAIHQYQALTGVVRCTCFIPLDRSSGNGTYKLPSDIDIIDKLEYYAVNVNLASGGVPIELVDFDYFAQHQQGYMLPASNNYSAVVSIPIPQSTIGSLQSSQFYATQYGCDLLMYPFSGVAGRLKIYYKPYLLPYTPDAEGRWSNFGSEPDATMATEHIPREFNAAYEGIKSYVAAQITGSIPQHDRLFPGKYRELMGKFNGGVEMILKTNPPKGVNNKTRPQIIRNVM